jgi:hypothetical protein
MALTVEDFRSYVGTDEVSDFVDACLEAGASLVSAFIGSAEVKEEVVDNAVLMCASEIFYRRQSPQGVTQFAAMDGTSMRAAKDPMNAARELLRPFVSYGV